MIRRHDTTPDTLDTSLRRRLDGVDKRLAQLDVLAADVAALGHGLADLTDQVTILGDTVTRGIVTAPNRAGAQTGPQAGGDVEEGQEGQPDWLTVTDPEQAAVWLTDALVFAEQVLARFPRGTLPACWPVHEVAVVEVIGLHRQWVDAYAGADPGAVSDLLGRWLPGSVRRVGHLVEECALHRAHQDNGHAYQVPVLDPGRVALWWVESRGTDPGPVEAFAMTRIS